MEMQDFNLGTAAKVFRFSCKRQKFEGKYLYFKGNIPLDWMTTAAKQCGRAFHVAMAIWHLRSLTKKDTFKMEQKHVRAFGVRRDAYHRGLAALERALLINVDRSRGRNAIITVIYNKKGN